MSKIDLSKAKIGDKFMTRGGCILEYVCEDSCDSDNKYLLEDEEGWRFKFYKYGDYVLTIVHHLDLVEQVFDDEKDRAITDKILKDADKVINGVAEAMPLIESAAIANLTREPLPENNEDDAELQRRQEVVQLAEKMYTMFENETLRCYLSCNDTYCSEDLVEIAFIRAAFFVNKKHKYLKEGEL